MTINQLLTFKTNTKSNDLDNFLPILDLKNISKNKKIVSNPNSFVDRQLKLIYGSDFLVSPDDSDLIILSEPNVETISTEEVSAFLEGYFKYMNIAKTNDIVVIHISSSNKWLGLFEEELLDANIPIYLNESEQTSTFLDYEKTININPFLPLSDFQHYSNEINKSIIIDLTLTSNSNRTYRLNFTKLINNIKGFDSLLIIINRSSTIPRLSNTKIKVIFEDEIDSEEFKHSTYVYVHTEEPYSLNSVNKVMYYAANSKVVFSNYNYYLNNTLPSIVMNLSRSFYDIRPFSDKEAFDILNESRNSIMYHY
ncbi:MAG TPA: hypothetical protein K8V35_05495, partial [Aliicoccus persicus]|nr:hypothetical protein [Aliicoccus persicus]